jgi:predicted nucleotidyltransferase
MIDIEKKYLDEIKEILYTQIPELEVRVFGSRVRGRASKYSDIDIAIKGKQPLSQARFSQLLEAAVSEPGCSCRENTYKTIPFLLT